MKIRRIAAATLAAASIAMLASSPAQAAVKPDVIVGSSSVAASMTFAQTSGDCEEGAADIIYGELNGSRLHEANIEVAAEKLGVLAVPSSLGSNWAGPDGIVKLFAHYGIKSKVGSHTIQTVEADLKAGDKIVAFVNADTIWSTLPVNTVFGTPPAGQAWVPITPDVNPVADHALVLDSINETKSTATLSDTGIGKTYTVSLATFRAAEAYSGYSYTVVTGK